MFHSVFKFLFTSVVQVIKGNMSRLHFRVCIKDGGGTVQELQGWIDCRDSCSQEFLVHEVSSLVLKFCRRGFESLGGFGHNGY